MKPGLVEYSDLARISLAEDFAHRYSVTVLHGAIAEGETDEFGVVEGVDRDDDFVDDDRV